MADPQLVVVSLRCHPPLLLPAALLLVLLLLLLAAPCSDLPCECTSAAKLHTPPPTAGSPSRGPDPLPLAETRVKRARVHLSAPVLQPLLASRQARQGKLPRAEGAIVNLLECTPSSFSSYLRLTSGGSSPPHLKTYGGAT